MATREELWLLGSNPSLCEQRLSHGAASMRGGELLATDAADDQLLTTTANEVARVRRLLPRGAEGVTARLVVSARRPGAGIVAESAVILAHGSLSLVSTPEHLPEDLGRLSQIAESRGDVKVDYRSLPVVWRNGSGAVLLHEAAGHPAEHGQHAVRWPAWLAVRDEPAVEVDDHGQLTRPVDLLASARPATARRASFSDVPLPRMSNVVVRHQGAPFELPARRLEILLTAGGRYEPLTGGVTVFVSAADLVEGQRRRGVQPFVIEEWRERVARALLGAAGDAETYPGVICSTEGQEIVVGSHAPLLLTHF